MGHIDVSGIDYSLSDGRILLNNVNFRVGDGAKVALIGANGSGKTTLLRMISGDLEPESGSIAISGGLGVMRQFIGSVRDGSTVRDLLLSVAPQRLQDAAAQVKKTEELMNTRNEERDQMAYAQALVDWGDAGGHAAHHSTQSVRAMKVNHGKYVGRQIGGGYFLAGLVQF